MLIIPPLFEQHNALRRQLNEVMRRLGARGIETLLPDLPGWNESLQPLDQQTLAHWREALSLLAGTFEISMVLAARSGALLAPPDLKSWLYAPQAGPQVLRPLIRARVIASREAGIEETSEAVLQEGRTSGTMLGGWQIGPGLFRELEAAETFGNPNHIVIEQSLIGGPGLWLRAEPDEDAEQADALVAAVLEDLAVPE